MRFPTTLLLLLLLLASSTFGQARVSRCWASCERNVLDPRLRATACSACLTSPDQSAVWLSKLPELPAELLQDQEWEVRWATLLLQARQRQSTAPHQLALWVARSPSGGEELQRACLTGLHAAGVLETSLAALLGADPKAVRRCLGRKKELEAALWVELYAEHPLVRLEALTHLAKAFERAPARVVLDALPSHAVAFDELVLDTFASWAVEARLSPAASLMGVATLTDVAAMNRVLAVYARRRDANRPLLASPQESVRRQALQQLCELAPLTEGELLGALADPVFTLRVMAAHGLARGEARSLAAMTGARLSGERPATLAQQQMLMTLTGEWEEPDCAPILLQTWKDRARAPELRRRALAVASSCSWAEAEAEVQAALTSDPVFERSSGVAALGFAPRKEQVTEQLLRAADASEPALRVAACQAIAQQRWRGGTARVAALSNDLEPEVRHEALLTLSALDAPGLEARLITALEKDAAPKVRATAAGLLSQFTSPRAISSLNRASRNDTDANVKLVAAQSLRRLAPGSLPP